jgi:hypothetical protein
MHGPTERPKQRFDHLEKIPEKKHLTCNIRVNITAEKAHKKEKRSQPCNSESTA